MRGQLPPDEFLNLGCESLAWCVSGLQHDESFDDLSAQGIRNSDGGRKSHGRMLHQALLDLAWTDPIAGSGDDIVGSSDEPELSLFVLPPSVARQQPFAQELLVCGFGVVPVAQEHDRVRTTDRDLALDATGATLPRSSKTTTS